MQLTDTQIELNLLKSKELRQPLDKNPNKNYVFNFCYLHHSWFHC